MIAVAIIAGAVIVVGLVLYLTHRPDSVPAAPSVDDNGCCGRHAVCEKTSLLRGIDDEVIYYDDEELDRFKDVNPEYYSLSDEEQFRDILLSLLPEDVPGWARSLEMRGIKLPEPVREELLMIVGETRSKVREING